MNRLSQILAAGAIASAALSVHAAAPFAAPQEYSPDLPLHASSLSAGRPARATSPATASSSVSEADVGDADSFGRNLHWLGLTDMSVQLSSDCTSADPSVACQTLSAAPAVTTFHFSDLGHITLPEKATNSLLCYWLSPVLDVNYGNSTAATVVASLRINPTLTVENPVLSTPGLIDPTTGLPFGGQLLTAMTSSQRFQVPLPAGIHISERKRDSAVCIAGFLSQKALVETYGLTSDQAKDFFKKPTTVRLNLAGSAQYVDAASLYFGFRIIGD